MAEPVQQRVGLDGVAKQRHPLLQAAITGQHQRAFLIALVNDVVQIVGLLLGQGLEPKVVNDQKIIAAVVLDAAIAGEIGPGRFQSTEQARSLDVAHVMTAAYRLVSQSQGDVTLAHTHRPAQADVFFVFQKAAGGQVIDAAPLDVRVKAKIELFEGLDLGKAGFLEPARKLGLGATLQLILNQQSQKVDVGQLSFFGLLEPHFQSVQQSSQSQLLELVEQMLIVTHETSRRCTK